MRIATWNINGIRARIDGAVQWTREVRPDILCLQEIKIEDQAFPRSVFEDLGYNIETYGQKSFNGVALLSKLPFDEVSRGLPGDDSDTQARFIEGVFSIKGGAIRVASLYLPNGNPVGTDKYAYKFAWMERLEDYAKARLAAEEMFVLAGDYNVIPEPIDARYPEVLDVGRALPAGDSRPLPPAAQPRAHLRLPRLLRRGRPLQLLGLSGRRLAAEQRHPHRPPAARAARRRPARRSADRQAHAELGQALRPRAGDHRARHVVGLMPDFGGQAPPLDYYKPGMVPYAKIIFP